MHCDETQKTCLNHSLTCDIEYTPIGSKSWFFIAEGISSDLTTFCLRFKSEDIARMFKLAIDDALGSKAAARDDASKQTGVGNGSEEKEREENSLSNFEMEPIFKPELPNSTYSGSFEANSFHTKLFQFNHYNGKWSSVGVGNVKINISPFIDFIG